MCCRAHCVSHCLFGAGPDLGHLAAARALTFATDQSGGLRAAQGSARRARGEAGLTGNFDAMLTNRMCVCGDFRKQLLLVAAAAVCDCVWHVARCTRYALLLLLLFATQCCTHTSDNNKNTGRQKKKGEQAQQKKDTLHTRLTTHARCTLHAQWAHLIVFVIARCCYCCWYYCCCYCCCCYVALCCTRRGEGTHDGKAREKCSKTRLVRAVG